MPMSQPLTRWRDAPPVRDLVHEHGVMLRQMAGLQQRVSAHCQAQAVRVAALESLNLRLQAELVLLRTAIFWGLGAGAVMRRPPVRHRLPAHPAEAMREAQAVICQTGCVGHAHPWLQADGQCSRTGQACDQLETSAVAPAEAPRAAGIGSGAAAA
ncbi:hypothetical protein GCM10007935_43910 [Hydrogenophaga electricum]|uniref:Uncharacterized protein n=2 Tax=Hydrogenophaga electricum TaxID=1230953 RepID=A0ABQ6CBC3_9BURK|nr:hypothetical protein GCM10007935_43910 [Hydrogenophaga electricum]